MKATVTIIGFILVTLFTLGANAHDGYNPLCGGGNWVKEEVWFSSFSNDVYYNTEVVKKIVTTRLSELGAKNISVKTNGGLEENDKTVRVNAVFDRIEEADYPRHNIGACPNQITISTKDNCNLNKDIMSALLPYFLIDRQPVEATGFCNPFNEAKGDLTYTVFVWKQVN